MEKKLLLQDLAERLAANQKISKKQAETFLKALFDVAEEALLRDKFVKIKGFGTFKVVAVNERESVSVNTGERIQINGHAKVTFTPDTLLRDLVNRPFSHFETIMLYDATDLEALENEAQETAAPPQPIAPVIPEVEAVVEEETPIAEGSEKAVPTEKAMDEEVTAEEIVGEETTAEDVVRAETPIAEMTQEDASTEEAVEEETPSPTRHTILYALLTLLLMLGSFTIGHNHWLLPCPAIPKAVDSSISTTSSPKPRSTSSTDAASAEKPAMQSASPKSVEATPDSTMEAAPKETALPPAPPSAPNAP